MADRDEAWPSEEEIEAQRRAAWRSLPAEQKLDWLEYFVGGLMAARAAGPIRPGDERPEPEGND